MTYVTPRRRKRCANCKKLFAFFEGKVCRKCGRLKSETGGHDTPKTVRQKGSTTSPSKNQNEKSARINKTP